MFSTHGSPKTSTLSPKSVGRQGGNKGQLMLISAHVAKPLSQSHGAVMLANPCCALELQLQEWSLRYQEGRQIDPDLDKWIVF